MGFICCSDKASSYACNCKLLLWNVISSILCWYGVRVTPVTLAQSVFSISLTKTWACMWHSLSLYLLTICLHFKSSCIRLLNNKIWRLLVVSFVSCPLLVSSFASCSLYVVLMIQNEKGSWEDLPDVTDKLLPSSDLELADCDDEKGNQSFLWMLCL